MFPQQSVQRHRVGIDPLFKNIVHVLIEVASQDLAIPLVECEAHSEHRVVVIRSLPVFVGDFGLIPKWHTHSYEVDGAGVGTGVIDILPQVVDLEEAFQEDAFEFAHDGPAAESGFDSAHRSEQVERSGFRRKQVKDILRDPLGDRLSYVPSSFWVIIHVIAICGERSIVSVLFRHLRSFSSFRLKQCMSVYLYRKCLMRYAHQQWLRKHFMFCFIPRKFRGSHLPKARIRLLLGLRILER